MSELGFGCLGGGRWPPRLIDDGVSENKIAKRIEKVLDDELPGDKFEVDRDDGEDVVVKKRFGEEDFGLEVIENTVKAVRIDLDKE